MIKKEDLCLGDIELLRDISTGKIDDDSNLNDSQRRSARFLYNSELITACPLEGADANIEALSISPLGKTILSQIDLT